MSDEIRADPEVLLKAIKAAEDKGKGHLKIFLGMAAGVGKTFSMLESAKKKMLEGIDVIVGIVYTHGRMETAKLLEGLKIIKERTISYKGKEFKELDLDEIVKIKPQLVLVDELAHTNVPGSRHLKRWQDVLEILEAGIDVYTTINIQHIESYKDIVEGITGISIRETVPDLVLEKATDIELVDLTPAELVQRLKEGKVYTGDLTDVAVQNFFQEDRLTALRELSLRFTAEVVDHELHEMVMAIQRGSGWKERERILVAINETENCELLIRTTRRLAFTLHAPWIVLFVDIGQTFDARENMRLSKNLELARELGAEVITTKDVDVVEGIRRIAEQRGVTQIVVGNPQKGGWKSLFKRPLAERLADEISNIDVHIIRQPLFLGEKKKKCRGVFSKSLYLVLMLLIIFAITIFSEFKIVGLILFLAIVIVTFFIIKIRESQKLVIQREHSTQAIYEIIRIIAEAPTLGNLFKVFKEKVGSILKGNCVIYIGFDEIQSLLTDDKEKAVATWVFEHGKEAGWSTSTLPSVKSLYIPLKGYREAVGVLSFTPNVDRELLPEDKNFLYTVAKQLANYLERHFSDERRWESRYHSQTEKIYERVLHSLSDELQKPLNVIQDAIIDCKKLARESSLIGPLYQIEQCSDTLQSIAENAAAMARLSAGIINFQKIASDVKELIETCTKKMEKILKNHQVVMRVSELPFIYFDPSLIEILLSNFLANSVENSPVQTTIEVEALVIEEQFILSVADEGRGIPEEMMGLVFEKFYRVPGTLSTGLGLGLAIAKSIAVMHDGTIKVQNRPTGGVKFSLIIPKD